VLTSAALGDRREMAIEIEPIRIEDFDELFPLVERFASSFATERAAFDRSARELVGRSDVWLGGARSSGALVGYCLGFEHVTFYANGPVSWIEEIVVAESQRRHGFGRALIAAFEQWARSRGSKLVGLATRRAEPFYDALGYERSATYYRRLL
jgi:GNAT superfamily N-acetyltransferase